MLARSRFWLYRNVIALFMFLSFRSQHVVPLEAPSDGRLEYEPYADAHPRMPVKGMLALYIGGMGARDKNFYNDYAKRLGYEAEAKKIQDLYLSGKKAEAMAAVPDKLVDEIALLGPRERIRDRVQAWKQAGKSGAVGSMLLGTGQPEALRLLAELVL